MWIWDQRRFR